MIKMITKMLVLLAVLLPRTAQAQVSGETEVGTDHKGGEFASQYVFYDWPKANLLTRYFWINNALSRFEIAIGPTVKVGQATWKMQFGGTTDREVMFAGLIVGKVSDRGLMYIYDLKVGTEKDAPNVLYQKFFAAIDKKSIWQFRIESLNVNSELAFLRIGAEYQIQFDAKHHIYIAPFYDPVVHSPGAQIGFRFF